MASRFSLESILTMTDGITRPMRAMTNNVEMASTRMRRSIEKVNRAQSALIKKIKLTAIVSLGLAASLIAHQFLNFDQAITAASAKFPELQKNTEIAKKTLQELKLTARAVGRDTQFSAAEAAQGLDFLAMAGFSAKQAMSLLPGVTNLATVANVDLARATDIASDAIGAFGMMTTDTAQLAKNFTRINDVMAATMTRANTNMEDLFESIKKGAASFTAAGQSLESFNALAGIMANSGLKGAESGTQLRNIMLRLAAPTKAATAVLNQLGVRTRDAHGNFRDIIDILTDFEKGTKGMGTAQKSAALATIFGARSVTGMNILLQEGTKNIRKFREGLIGASGASQEMANIMRQSLTNKLKALLSAVIELGFKFIDAFSAKGANAIDKLTEVARNLGPVFETAGKILSTILGFMPTLIKLYISYKAAIIAITLAQKAQIAIGWIKYLWMMRGAIQKAIVAQKGLNLAMIQNPIGLLVAALAGAIYYITWLVTKTKEAIAVFMKLTSVLDNPIINALLRTIPGMSTAMALRERIKKQQTSSQPIYASPNTGMNTTHTNKTQVDVNFNNAPKGTTIKSTGKPAPLTTLNLGVNPA